MRNVRFLLLVVAFRIDALRSTSLKERRKRRRRMRRRGEEN